MWSASPTARGHPKRGDTVCSNKLVKPLTVMHASLTAALNKALRPAVVKAIIAGVFEQLDPVTTTANVDGLKKDLRALDSKIARLTEAVAIGTERIPTLVERLRVVERKRRDLLARLDRSRTLSLPTWNRIERDMHTQLAEVRSTLTGNVARARQAFREGLPTESIRFTPTVERGYRALRFEGRWGLRAVFGAELVTKMASPPGFDEFCRAESHGNIEWLTGRKTDSGGYHPFEETRMSLKLIPDVT
jgi:hypothetical protein